MKAFTLSFDGGCSTCMGRTSSRRSTQPLHRIPYGRSLKHVSTYGYVSREKQKTSLGRPQPLTARGRAEIVGERIARRGRWKIATRNPPKYLGAWETHQPRHDSKQNDKRPSENSRAGVRTEPYTHVAGCIQESATTEDQGTANFW